MLLCLKLDIDSSLRPHTSAYASIRQHTSAYGRDDAALPEAMLLSLTLDIDRDTKYKIYN